MKKDYTDITVVLDSSGSMGRIKDDTIGGFNDFLDEQKKVKGTATISLVQFNIVDKVIYTAKNIKNADKLSDENFKTRGSTSLYDAVGNTVNKTGNRLRNLPESKRPDKVIFIIFTDGQENTSTEFKSDDIKELINTQTNNYKWEFVFIGADQNAALASRKMGIKLANTLSTVSNEEGIGNSYLSVNSAVSRYRAGGQSVNFTSEDRKKQKKAGSKH